MNELFEKLEVPELPESWSSKRSVKKVQKFITNYKKLNKEMFCELWIAREKLSGASETIGTDSPITLWEKYCQDVGVPRQTINRWLKRAFEPDSERQTSIDWKVVDDYKNSALSVMKEINQDCSGSPDPMRYFGTEAGRSLAKKVKGNVYLDTCNLPIERGDMNRVARKIRERIENGTVTQAIVAFKHDMTCEDWFTPMYDGLICMTDHKMKLVGENGNGPTNGNGRNGICFVYFGANLEAFINEYRQYGTILTKVEQAKKIRPRKPAGKRETE